MHRPAELGESMNKVAGRLAEIPAGSWTKWIVGSCWLVVLVIALPLSGKLTGEEKNNASAWLPASAESTKVLDLQAHFQSPNIFPAVVARLNTRSGRDGAVAVLAAITLTPGEVTTRVAAYAAGCGMVAAALAIALLRHAPKPAASAVAREVRA